MGKTVFILLLTSFLLFWRLGETHLTNWDEAWYADVARTMSEKGNVLTPLWNGQPFLEKPPLFYWLTALSYRVFGDTEFSARFVSALAGFGTVLLVYKFAGVSSALILLSTPVFLWRARTGNLDSLLTYLIFFSAVIPRYTGLASGLAFLTKGAIGFLFPITSLRIKQLVFAVILSFVWLVLMYFVNGRVFLQQFFAQQGEKIGTVHFSLDYITHLKTGLKLWLIVFIPALYYVRLSFFSRFIIVFLVLISFLQEKSTWFLHPLYPFIAVIVGQFLSRWKKSIIFVVIIALFQLVYYRAEYFVPNIASDEARIAIASKELTKSDDVIYLTHYYYPTAIYYSRRKTYAVYSENPSVSWWILPRSAWGQILLKERVFINTSKDEFKELSRQFPSVRFKILFTSGDKLLVSKAE